MEEVPPRGDRARPHRFHRSHRHLQAHAENIIETQFPTCAHPLVCQDAPHLITRQDELAALLDHLRVAGVFAYDSEFIGELTYIPKLCLIQVATTQRVALIDPLSNVDSRPFWELVADPAVEKVVHAGQQDVEPMFRELGRAPSNLFDTQLCGGFIALGYPLSLSKLVESLIGVKLSKGLTFTHWDKRPLTAQQLRYAADDVRYLPALRSEIGKKLDALGHTEWAMEESAGLADPSLYEFDPHSQYLKIRGATSLRPRNLAILRELTIWRDQAARQDDVPPRSLLKDEIILEMAKNPVDSIVGLAKVRGLPRPVESRHGTGLIEAVRRGNSIHDEELPTSRAEEPPPAERFRADALYVAAQCLCVGQQIDPALVTSRQEIFELYRLYMSGDDPSPLRILKGWRRAAVGQRLLDILDAQAELTLRWRQGTLHAHLSPNQPTPPVDDG